MIPAPTLSATQEHAESAHRIAREMRRHRRVQIDLAGRYLRADRNEHNCRAIDLSVGGAQLRSDARMEPGEKIVVYFEHLGGFDAEVVRATSDGFAIQFNVSEYKREKLAAQMMWLLNKDAYPSEAGRAHQRTLTAARHARLETEPGVVIDAKVLDLSISGASLKTAARPAIGSFLTANGIRAIVRRHHPDGISIQFLKVLNQEALAQTFP